MKYIEITTMEYMFMLVSLILCNFCHGFNIDIESVEQFTGTTGSQFGYSSTLLNNAAGSWVIVGAPRDNMTTATFLRNPGNVYRCQLLQNTKSCQPFIIRTNEGTRPSGYYGYEEDNQFLGGSIVRTATKIVACAQLWKDLSDQSNRIERPVGRCHDINHNFNSIETDKRIRYNSYYSNGYSYGMALIGTVAVPTDIDDEVMVGGPGMWNDQGGFIFYEADKTNNFFTTYSAKTSNTLYNGLLDNAEMGLSIDVGRIGPQSGCSRTTVVAGIPHFANNDGHLGSFVVLCPTGGGTNLGVRKQFIGNKIGSGYGLSICIADVNNDGNNDVLVGAPLQKVVSYDEGTVFVYYGTGDSQYLDSSVQNIYGNNQGGGRFGATIVNLGDINKDNIDDIAIGAPNEDEGAGAVYIFNGRSGRMNEVHSQRIAAKTSFNGIKSFGTYISRPLDIDNNKYADLAVGAFQSDTTFLFRTSPVITMTSRVTFNPPIVPLTSAGLQCATPSNDNPCVTVSVCFRYTGTEVPVSTRVNYTLNADTTITGQSKTRRVDLYKGTTNHEGVFNSNPISVSISGETCDDVYARVMSTSRDFFSQISISLDFQAQFQLAETTNGGVVKPVQDANTPTTITDGTTFMTGCSGVCAPDLQVDITKDVISIIYGQTIDYSFTVRVINKGEPGFGVRLIADISSDNALFLDATPLLTDGSVQLTCAKAMDANNRSVVHCDVNSVLYQKQFGAVRLRYNVTSAALSENVTYSDLLPYVRLTVTASAIGNEVSPGDNTDTETQDVTFSADMAISGVSTPEQSRVSETKDKFRTFSHSYDIFNNGPSPLFASKVLFAIPAITDTTDILVQTKAYKIISTDQKSNCTILLVPGLHVGLKMQISAEAQTNNAVGAQKIADCEGLNDPKCVVVECLIQTLVPSENTLIDVQFDVTESSLNIDSINEFQFFTTAVINPVKSEFPDSLKANKTAKTVSFIYPASLVTPDQEINLWIIVGSVIAGVVLFIVLGILLWKCGFFKREKKDKIDKWKRQSNFHEQRKTQRLSRLSKPKDDEVTLSI
ncbi:integrin alpha 8 [Mytilus galloprovincialis]|uniref:Integrin alpha 8 n=1 Tax=Mytilus galloprovincialis TaxID=29158 RepID=A0A8B6C9V3_MYTGA|nr:integrin alpha 8 [Mytilus galloprovincialis]